MSSETLEHPPAQAEHQRRFLAPAAVIFIAGVALRVIYALPDHRFPNEADCSLTGITALDILAGHLRVFYSGVRLGAFESYLTAGWFALAGVSHVGLSVGPIVASSLTLLFFGLFARDTLGPRAGLVALVFFAFPSPTYVFFTSSPTSYSETMLFASAALWLSARITRTGETGWPAVAFGLACGLGFWNCFLTLAVSIPALIWILRQRSGVPRARVLARSLAGFLAGALPWMAFNLRYPLASFHHNFAVRPSTGFLANTKYFLTHDIPALTLASYGASGHLTPQSTSLAGTALLVAIFALAAVAFLASAKREPEKILLLVVLAVFAFNVFSEPGSRRGLNARYAIPVYFAIVVGLTRLCQIVGRRSRLAAIGIASVVLTLNLLSYSWPWTAERNAWERAEHEEERLVKFLQEERIGYVIGDYWDSYPVNFDSRLTIKGIPYRTVTDNFRFEQQLDRATPSVAVISSDLESIRSVVREASIAGQIYEFGATSFAFLPRPNPPKDVPASAFIARIRKARLSSTSLVKESNAGRALIE